MSSPSRLKHSSGYLVYSDPPGLPGHYVVQAVHNIQSNKGDIIYSYELEPELGFATPKSELALSLLRASFKESGMRCIKNPTIDPTVLEAWVWERGDDVQVSH